MKLPITLRSKIIPQYWTSLTSLRK